jgi:hypothetical protein
MKKTFLLLLIISFVFINCSQTDKYTINKEKVGLITKKTEIKDLAKIFKSDSLVSVLFDSVANENNPLYLQANDTYTIYTKNGDKLLEITPEKLNNPSSTIKSVQIFNANYKTTKGITLKSSFAEIYKNYTINKVETTLTSATLFIDELNATIAIDKKDLGINSFSSNEITVEQIPDDAKIKYFTIWFN